MGSVVESVLHQRDLDPAMTLAAVTIVTAFLFGGLGVLFGAWQSRCRQSLLHVVRNEAAPPGPPFSVAAEQKPVAPDEKMGQGKLLLAEQILATIYDMSEGLAADVDRHNNQVTEINEELIQLEDPAPVVLKTIERLVFANREMQSRLVQAEKQLQLQGSRLKSLSNDALTDSLTGVANRRAFDLTLTREHAKYQNEGEPLSLIILDIDKFKPFNDQYGHQVGDEVLRSVANVLRTKTDANDVLARYGGEEFAAVLPGVTLTTALDVAERLRGATEKSRWTFENLSLGVTVSVGAAQLLPGESIDDLIGRADEALYASKRAGRNCGHGHDGQICFPLTAAVDDAQGKRTKVDIQTPTSSDKQPSSSESTAPSLPAKNRGASSLYRDAERCGEALRRVVECKSEPCTAKEPAVLASNKAAKSSAVAPRSPGTSEKKMQRRLTEQKGSGETVSILWAQVDQFGQIVASQGKSTGEQVISSVLRLLRGTIRGCDYLTSVHNGAFALSLPNVSFEELAEIAHNMQREISQCEFSLEGGPALLTVSVGVAEGANSENAEQLIQRAQWAMATAQERGGDACFYYSGEASHPLLVKS